MDGDHERIHELRQKLEQQERVRDLGEPGAQDQEPAASQGGTEPVPEPSDSEQAEANLDQMLETGEENPIS